MNKLNRFTSYGIEEEVIESTEPTKPVEVKEDSSGSVSTKNVSEDIIKEESDNSETIEIGNRNADADIVPKKKLVFLGGTCNESLWRDKLIDGLEMSYFNPVVQDWNEDDKEKENQIKDSADYNLFVITPKHSGFFSFVEFSLLAIKSPSRTILCVLEDDDGVKFEESTKKSLDAIVEEISKQNVKVFNSLDEVRSFLNEQNKEVK